MYGGRLAFETKMMRIDGLGEVVTAWELEVERIGDPTSEVFPLTKSTYAIDRVPIVVLLTHQW